MSTKAARGTKRVCQSCGNKFYDLNRDPIACPICGAVFQHQETRSKPAPPPTTEDDEDDDFDDDEVEDQESADEPMDPIATETPAPEGRA